MGINLGSTAISGIKLGTTQVDKIYLGSTQIYGGSTPPTPTPTFPTDYPGFGYIVLDDDTVLNFHDETEVESLCTSSPEVDESLVDPAEVVEIVLGGNMNGIPVSNYFATGNNNSYSGNGYTNVRKVTVPSGFSAGNHFMAGSDLSDGIVFCVDSNDTCQVQFGTYFLRQSNITGIAFPPDGGFSFGNYALTSCLSFNSDIHMPASISFGGGFMNNCDAMCSTIYIGSLDAGVIGGSASLKSRTLATTNSSAPMYTTGITLVGDYVSDWMDALPNNDSGTYYRNLIDGTAS